MHEKRSIFIESSVNFKIQAIFLSFYFENSRYIKNNNIQNQIVNISHIQMFTAD